MLASLGTWLTRRFGVPLPVEPFGIGPLPDVRRYMVISDIIGIRTVTGGPYTSLVMAEYAANIARVQMAGLGWPVVVRVEPWRDIVERSQPDASHDPGEAKP